MPTINKKKKYKQTSYIHYNYSSRFYNSKGWKTLRKWFLTCNPLCVECAAKGITTVATDVHHRVPFLTGKTESEQWKLFLDENNLMPLCDKCHHEIHKRLKNVNRLNC